MKDRVALLVVAAAAFTASAPASAYDVCADDCKYYFSLDLEECHLEYTIEGNLLLYVECVNFANYNYNECKDVCHEDPPAEDQE